MFAENAGEKMGNKTKITEGNVRESLAKGMTIQEIATEYGVVSRTVLKIKQAMEKRDSEEAAGVKPTTGNKAPKGAKLTITDIGTKFDLKIGDIISAIESEISKKRNIYEVVAIYEEIYIGEKQNGGGTWRTTFRKDEYMKSYDPCAVRLVSRKAKSDD